MPGLGKMETFRKDLARLSPNFQGVILLHLEVIVHHYRWGQNRKMRHLDSYRGSERPTCKKDCPTKCNQSALGVKLPGPSCLSVLAGDP